MEGGGGGGSSTGMFIGSLSFMSALGASTKTVMKYGPAPHHATIVSDGGEDPDPILAEEDERAVAEMVADTCDVSGDLTDIRNREPEPHDGFHWQRGCWEAWRWHGSGWRWKSWA